MQESTVYHFTKINSDNNGNPQYKFNVYIQPLSNGRTLRLQTPKLGARFSKRHDAYIVKYWGNEDQVAQIIEKMIEAAGYKIGTIA
jgi:hypothetical protein